MRVAFDILAMLPADSIGHFAVPCGERIAEAALLVALVLGAALIAVLGRARG